VAGGASIDSLAYRQLIAGAGEARSVGELFAAASRRLRRLVSFDAAVWLASDPATGLPTAPTRTENMDGFGLAACLRAWELEFMVEDVNLFGRLARAPVPAAGLRQATGDRPARSPRYRELLRGHGFEDELRGVLRAGGEPWGLVALFRREGGPAFDAGESAVVARLSAPLGAAVRDHARPEAIPFAQAEPGGPGLLLFAPSGELISVNDDALAWLDELTCDGEAANRDAFEMPLPIVVVSTLMRARAIAEKLDRGSARARIRSPATGRWLVCHASCLRGADGGIGDTALVIEPAKGSEIAPIITQAYGLSPREQEITGLLARGLSTADIAEALCLSTHTVRDYIKTTLDKAGVSSRGELVAKLFAEHYAPVHLAPDGIERARPAA
jgi:DNA-binding CsgD family transcriptional regulator